MGKSISIDPTAAGWGWDTMYPNDAAPRIDLETVLLHELGLALGYSEADPRQPAVMARTLAAQVGSQTPPAVASETTTTSAPATATVAPLAISGAQSVSIAADSSQITVTVDGAVTSYALGSISSFSIQTRKLTVSAPTATWTINADGSGSVDAAGIPLIDFGDVMQIIASSGAAALRGPPTDSLWHITGPDSGTLAGISFAGFQNLVGAAGNQDTFTVEQGGSISGTIDGGDGGFDTVSFPGHYGSFVSKPVDGHSGIVIVDGTLFTYAGLEPLNVGSADAVDFELGGGDDVATLTQSGGTLTLATTSGTAESTSFATPMTSLTINAGGGNDSITVSGTVALPGASLTLTAETITVAAAAKIDTSSTTGDAGAITLTGQSITLATGATLLADVASAAQSAGKITLEADMELAHEATGFLPVGVSINTATVSISGATIHGGDVSIKATAADTLLTNNSALGEYTQGWLNGLENLVDQIPDLVLSALWGISGQVDYRSATATIGVSGSSITSGGSLQIAADASSNASLHVVSYNGANTDGKFAVAIGVGSANSLASVTIDKSTLVGNDVSITSNADTNAFVKARTAANSNPIADPNGDTFAIAVAVVNTNETSHVTISDPTSSISALDGPVVISATGSVLNFAWSQPSIGDDGTVALALAVDVDIADLKTDVDGSIDAKGGLSTTGDAQTFSAKSISDGGAVDYGLNTISIPMHGFTDGALVTYTPGQTGVANESVPPIGCTGCDGGVLKTSPDSDNPNLYVVQVVDENTIRLSLAPTLKLAYDATSAGTVTHTLATLEKIDFDSSDVFVNSEQIRLWGTSFAVGDTLQYLGTSTTPSTNAPVQGLQDGHWYRVTAVTSGFDVVRGAYQLLTFEDATEIVFNSSATGAVDLTDAGSGMHSFIYEKQVVAFDPATAVDSTSNTITFTTPHGLQTGDGVIYRTDPGRSTITSLPPSVFTINVSATQRRHVHASGRPDGPRRERLGRDGRAGRPHVPDDGQRYPGVRPGNRPHDDQAGRERPQPRRGRPSRRHHHRDRQSPPTRRSRDSRTAGSTTS